MNKFIFIRLHLLIDVPFLELFCLYITALLRNMSNNNL